MLTSFILNGRLGDTPLDVTPYVESYDFPEATLTSWGEDLENAGQTAPERAYNDAPWSFTLAPVDMADQATVSAWISAAHKLVVPGATISLSEDDCLPVTVTLKQRAISGRQAYQTWGRASWNGTRWPAFEGRTVTFGPISVPLFGTADLDSTPAGDLEAAVDLRMTVGVATSGMWLGVKHDPGASYDPVDDYSGYTGDSPNYCIGGARTTSASLPAALGSAPAVDVNDNRGPHELIARVKASDTTAKFYAESVVTPTIGDSVTAANPSKTVGATTLKALDLGMVTVPVQDVPNIGSGSAYAPETIVASQTSSSTVVGPLTGPLNLGTITVGSSGQNAHVQIESRSSVAPTGFPASYRSCVVQFTNNATGAIHTGQMFATTAESGYDYKDVYSLSGGGWGGIIPKLYLPAGTYTAMTTDYDGTWYFHLTSGQSNYKLWQQLLINFGATTPVLGTGSGTGSVDVATRIPLSDWAVMCATSLLADEGVRANSFLRTRYRTNSSGDMGASLGAGAQMRGIRPGFAPGVVNRFVAAADVGNTTPGNMTVSGTYTERWTTRTRSV